MLQIPNSTPLATSSSTAMPGNGRSPGFTYANGLRAAAALVAASLILKASPSLYFGHMSLFIPNGMALCRRTMTTVFSASVVP